VETGTDLQGCRIEAGHRGSSGHAVGASIASQESLGGSGSPLQNGPNLAGIVVSRRLLADHLIATTH